MMAISIAFLGFNASASSAVEDLDRTATIQMINTKYIPVLDKQLSELRAIKVKVKSVPSLLKQTNTVLTELEDNYKTIVEALGNPNQELKPIIDLCEEEVEEFENYIYLLNQQISKLKTITCIKSKNVKKIVGLSPKCPAGYKRK